MEQEKQAREELASRLRGRRDELEQAVAARVRAIGDPQEPRDPVYLESRRAAVSAALDYGLSGVELGSHRVPLPPILLAQARLAARFGISLDTVLRRYFAGYTLFCDFLAEAARPASESPLRGILRSQAQLFDRLLAEVTEEYRREPPSLLSSPEERRAEQVEKLLAGELADLVELGYELKGWHVAVIAPDGEWTAGLRELGAAIDRRMLEVRQQDGQSWIWLGGRREPDMSELSTLLAQRVPPQVQLAVGEPGEGPSGWRLSHRQARAAWSVGNRGGDGITRYVDVALLASMLRDELLTTSLRQLFIEPLGAERGGGDRVLKETLDAYFAAGRNVSSAASALKVTRQTVGNRLRAVERSLGRSLLQCGLALEAALLLESAILQNGQSLDFPQWRSAH
ncbi:MAG TPA: helix-turn-helix domain-containing protein [Solirubrobacterales bacterium]|nr:helix-turn-helix domain-containing protein [Solirubrobacterales bacterium]